jgi:hypothetical protein
VFVSNVCQNAKSTFFCTVFFFFDDNEKDAQFAKWAAFLNDLKS